MSSISVVFGIPGAGKSHLTDALQIQEKKTILFDSDPIAKIFSDLGHAEELCFDMAASCFVQCCLANKKNNNHFVFVDSMTSQKRWEIIRCLDDVINKEISLIRIQCSIETAAFRIASRSEQLVKDDISSLKEKQELLDQLDFDYKIIENDDNDNIEQKVVELIRRICV